MGWENRDYARNSDYSHAGGFGFERWPPVVKAIIIANVVIFVAQFLFQRELTVDEYVDRIFEPANIERVSKQIERETGIQFDKAAFEEGFEIQKAALKRYLRENEVQFYIEPVSVVTEAFQLDTSKVMSGQVWRLITSGFCHDQSSVWHIAVNMLVFFWFGNVIERIYGSREFALFYFVALAVSGVAVVGVDLWTGQNIPAIGASGAVMAVMMLFAIHFPRHTVLLFFIIPVEARFLVVIYCIFDLHPLLMALAGQPLDTGVAHAGHLGGLAFGFLYWQWQIRLEPWVFRRASNRRRPNQPSSRRGTRRGQQQATILLYDPESLEAETESKDEFDEAVDDVLRKIQLTGVESLTEEEKRTLTRASSWYQDRQDLE